MKEDTNKPNLWGWWFIAIGICLAICIGGAFLSFWIAGEYICNTDGCPSALFGDSFGAVNALISAFAFAGMIVTFVLQRYELKLQRHELAAQRNEFHQQNDTLQMQRFENTFFHMLELQQEIVNELNISDIKKVNVMEDSENYMGRLSKQVPVTQEIKGRNLFFYAFCQSPHIIGKGKEVNGMSEVLQNIGIQAYYNYYTPTYFDHYFRHFYTILKFINTNDWLGYEKQYQYASFLRATLSRYELVWLYYNGLTFGKRKLKPLLEKYTMFNNLRPELLTLCKENADLLQGKAHSLQANGFSGTDYEFFLSDGNEEDKYNLRAFYRENNEKGQNTLNRWKDFQDNYIENVKLK